MKLLLVVSKLLTGFESPGGEVLTLYQAVRWRVHKDSNLGPR
jgi:hypothetical protein